MKKLLLSLCTAVIILTACDNQPKFSIQGVVEQGEAEQALLLKAGKDGVDTLAKADIKNGKFTLTGRVEKDDFAVIIINPVQKRGGIYLENAKYNANIKLDSVNAVFVTGTDNQAILNKFNALDTKVYHKLEKLRPLYAAAMESKDEKKAEKIAKDFEDFSNAMRDETTKLIEANLNSPIAAYKIFGERNQIEFAKVEELYNKLNDDVKNTESAKRLNEFITKSKAVSVGQIAPDFTQKNTEGKDVSLHSIKAKVKIVDFWASWCGPCRAENPNVVNIYKKYHKKGLEILGVSLDEKEDAWKKAIKDDKLTWLHVSDLKGWRNAVAQKYNVNAIPAMFVLDENNKIVAKNLRGKELENKIAELLK